MEQKIFLITGGSSGLGLAIAEKLSREPDNVVISTSRSQKKIQRALDQNPSLKGKVLFLKGDVSKPDDCKKIKEQIESRFGKLHGLVNNAGVLTKGGMEMVTYEQWKFNLDINLNGPYLLTQTLLPLLKKAKGASVVNVSSIASVRPGSSVAYSVSKAGLDMLTEFLAGDLGPYKIRVNSINPGLVKTNIHLDNQIVEDKEAYSNLLENAIPRYPIGRIGEPEDIASLAVFLLSDQAEWITGSIIKIDGGAAVFNDLIPPK